MMNQQKCPFCIKNIKSQIIEQENSVVVIEDRNPVSPGHSLVIPIRHCPDYLSMTRQEQEDAVVLLKRLKKKVLNEDPLVTGFNIGMNIGESAGQTVFHCHIHLIPRRKGDTPNPRGGVRGVIPGRMNY